MELAVIGTGYVGLVAGTCFAEMGHHVVCIDTDHQKIAQLNQGIVPIYEPRLKGLIDRNKDRGRLHFVGEIDVGIQSAEVIFIAVGTPQKSDGSADLGQVMSAARSIASAISRSLVVAIKSTVPVGTADRVQDLIGPRDFAVDVVSNPEFMKEGAAVDDFLKPVRIILGTQSPSAQKIMSDLYAPFQRTSNRIILMDTRSAEMSKYVSNAMLATRISFMNEIAGLCERTGADVTKVRAGVGSDPRIGPSFLFPGTGFGGSCLPKDIRALLYAARTHGQALEVLDAVERVNSQQKSVLVRKLVATLGEDLTGHRIAVWGLAFKPQTDDMREAPSITIIQELLARGAEVHAADPAANRTAEVLFRDQITIHEDPYEALAGATALVLVTEWNEFRHPDFSRIHRSLLKPYVFDGRNLFDPVAMNRMGFQYFCIGRPKQDG